MATSIIISAIWRSCSRANESVRCDLAGQQQGTSRCETSERQSECYCASASARACSLAKMSRASSAAARAESLLDADATFPAGSAGIEADEMLNRSESRVVWISAHFLRERKDEDQSR